MITKSIEILDNAIKSVKKLAKPNDNDMVFIHTKKGMTMVTFIGLEKYQAKMTLESMRILHDNPEMILVSNVWMSSPKSKDEMKHNDFIRPRDDPNRKDAFVLSYFSKGYETAQVMPYKILKDNKLRWLKSNTYNDIKTDVESSWNPYKFSKEQINEWLERSKIDTFKKGSKKTVESLPLKFRMEIFRKDDKVMFEVFNAKNVPFIRTTIMSDDDAFRIRHREALTFLRNAGQLCKEKKNK